MANISDFLSKLIRQPNVSQYEDSPLDPFEYKQSPMDLMAPEDSPIKDPMAYMPAQEANVPDESQEYRNPAAESQNPEQNSEKPKQDIQQIAPKIPQSIPEESNLNRYQQLLEAYNNRNRNLGLAQAGNQLAQAIAAGHGARIGSGSEAIQAMQAQNLSPDKQIAAEDAAQMADPNSDVSNFYRQQAYAMLKKINPNSTWDGKLEGMSASQLEKLGLKGALGSDRGRRLIPGVLSSNGKPIFSDDTGMIYEGGSPDAYDAGKGFRSQYGKMIEGPQGEQVSYDQVARNYANIFGGNGAAPNQKVPVEAGTQQSQQQEPQINDVDYLDDMKAKRPQAVKLMENVRSDLEKSENFKRLNEAVDSINTSKELIARNMPGSAPMLARALLSIYESGGRFTDQDVEQMKGPTDLKAKMKRFLVTNFDSEAAVSDIDQSAQRELLKVLEEKKRQQLGMQYYNKVNTLAKQGLDKDFLARYLSGDRIKNASDIPKPIELGKSAGGKSKYAPGTVLKLKDGRTVVVGQDGETLMEKK